MEYTKNYKLPQWVETDRIMMEDFNQAMASIENGISQALTTAEEGQQTLAEQIETELGELGNSLRNVTADVGSGSKNCRIAYGSYIGTGTYGAANPNSLTFGFYPVMMYVIDLEEAQRGTNVTCFLRSCDNVVTSMSSSTTLNWSNIGISWYNNGSTGYQYNTSGHTYYYCAIGYSNS